MTVNCGCLFLCQNEGILRHFRRVENEAGERVGVADAPQPNLHQPAMPTVSWFVGIFGGGFYRGQCLIHGVTIGGVHSKKARNSKKNIGVKSGGERMYGKE